MLHHRLIRLLALLVVTLLAVGACSSDDDGDSGSSSGSGDSTSDDSTTDDSAGGGATDEAEAETLRILVTDDDGVEGSGYVALVEGLQEVSDVELTLSAPAENQSGSSDSTTPGGLPASSETEVAGLPATAVDGFPADSVLAAIEAAPDGAESFDLVVSGINEGQNVGSIEQLSGTVGVARTGARNGIPAFAVSQGLTGNTPEGAELDYADAVELTQAWIEENRSLILEHPEGDPGFLYNLNVPTCATGEFQGQIELDEGGVDVAGRDTLQGACTGGEPTDEVDAFIRGYAPLVPLPAD